MDKRVLQMTCHNGVSQREGTFGRSNSSMDLFVNNTKIPIVLNLTNIAIY